MGDISEDMLDGTICQGCGELLSEKPGYPRVCGMCQEQAPKARKVPKAIAMKLEKFAQQFPVGTKVKYSPLRGVSLETEIRSEPWVTENMDIVVRVNSHSSVLINHIKAR